MGPEQRVERPRPLEPDQVARPLNFRHQNLPIRRHRWKPHEEAVQIRRQGKEVNETPHRIVIVIVIVIVINIGRLPSLPKASRAGEEGSLHYFFSFPNHIWSYDRI